MPAIPSSAEPAAPAAYLALGERLGLRAGLPYTHNWTAAPDFLELIARHALTHAPKTIVECGSGLSSLILARCCELNGCGQVFSLECGPQYAAATRAELARYGLAGRATVLDAPLTRLYLRGQEHPWYDLAGLPPVEVDMLVVDGPSGFIGRHARYPALPCLYGSLAGHCVIFLDDAARADEREIVGMWLADFPALRHEYIETERGCSVLRLQASSGAAASSQKR